MHHRSSNLWPVSRKEGFWICSGSTLICKWSFELGNSKFQRSRNSKSIRFFRKGINSRKQRLYCSLMNSTPSCRQTQQLLLKPSSITSTFTTPSARSIGETISRESSTRKKLRRYSRNWTSTNREWSASSNSSENWVFSWTVTFVTETSTGCSIVSPMMVNSSRVPKCSRCSVESD